jgi:general secretion pathway protein G
MISRQKKALVCRHVLRGFSLVELIVALTIMSLLAAVAVPMYGQHIERAKVAKAIGDIRGLHVAIDTYRLRNRDLVPSTLAELNIDIPDDPWGRPYQFLNIIDGNPKTSLLRKDGALNPINTDYDLYSLGADGESQPPLSAGKSQDDIVRANNGAFVGLGSDY